MRTLRALRFAVAGIMCLAGGAAEAAVVGERHLTTTDSTAALRDAEHLPRIRVTVWYPAADTAKEQRIDIGPPGRPLFEVGAVAPDAPFADAKRRPVILFSHGFGGSARMMAWFGLAMARAGYVVVAVDHPGNNGSDKMTAAGVVLHWNRADDLRAALDQVVRDAVLGPHVDPGRVGVSGFSAGGYTALVAAGARANPARLVDFCRTHLDDGVCLPQKEFPIPFDQAVAAATSPALVAEVARAGDDHSIPGLRAAFAIAPAIVQELTPESLEQIHIPVTIVLGDADPVAPPATNGLVAAKLIPNAEVETLPGVGHYDFLSSCTAAGKVSVPVCDAKVSQKLTHETAVAAALALFRRTLGDPSSAVAARQSELGPPSTLLRGRFPGAAKRQNSIR